jgi:hypothetical protein
VLLSGRRALACVPLALALGGCGGGDDAPATTSSLPPGCEVPQIDPIVNGFLSAVNAGDTDALRRLVPGSPNYLVHDGRGRGERRVHLTSERAVLAYFAARHRLHERQRVVSLRVAPASDANHVLVELRLTRIADDFARRGILSRLAGGTGRVDCVERTIDKLLIQGP